MGDTWDILKQELLAYGFKLQDNQICQFYRSDGSSRQGHVSQIIKLISKEIKENIVLFHSLFEDMFNFLAEYTDEPLTAGEKEINLFIFSIKDTMRLMDCFAELDDSDMSDLMQNYLERDINTFTQKQIRFLPDYKISIDWVLRLITRLQYTKKLLSFSMLGRSKVAPFQIKEARGISGPWSNLDLPARERVWDWNEEDENYRGRDSDIRNQRRYTKGFSNYNNDGRVGEGHYWREIRNEPFSWANREEDDPYPHRNTVTRP